MISEEDVEKALDYLSESADKYAKYRTAEKHYEQMLKRIESVKFMEQEKGAVEAKRMAARASDEYGQCIEDYKESKYNCELLEARRNACQLKISLYQTQMKCKIGGY